MKRYLYITKIAVLFIISGCSSILILNNPNHLYNHVKFLASDKLEGRFPGSKGGYLAADYIRNEYEKNNLILLDEEGFQNFEIVSKVELGPGNKLIFNNKQFVINKDFIPLSFGKNTLLSAQIFFAGYGFSIKNDSLHWNDYKYSDLSNHWVMILRGSPDGDNPHSQYSDYSSLRKKALIAKDNSAAGIIFVSGQEFDNADDLIPLSYDQSQQDIGIPIVHIKRKLANAILNKNNTSIESLEKNINKNLENSINFFINDSISVSTDIIYKKTNTQNVVGVLEGNDLNLKDEYIVIGAHYDHLGYGGDKSGSRRPYINAIHNGADDNASGVSILIELAKLLSKSNINKRSILFVAFGAEEMGLIGSKYFVNSNLIPMEKIQIMINMDMVGKLNEEKILNVSGTQTGIGLEKKLNKAFNLYGIQSTFNSQGYGPSDHSSFYVNDVPVLFFFTGGHSDYHTPEDDYEKLNYNGMEIIKNLLFSLINTFDQSDKIVFQEAGPKEQKRPSRFKVTLGIMPDYVFNEIKGLRIDAVIPEKPASKAGMLDGDIIIKMDDKPVGDIYEYMHRLSEFNSGETINIIVIREGVELILKVTF